MTALTLTMRFKFRMEWAAAGVRGLVSTSGRRVHDNPTTAVVYLTT